jgi:hypothetical protein
MPSGHPQRHDIISKIDRKIAAMKCTSILALRLLLWHQRIAGHAAVCLDREQPFHGSAHG